MKHLELLFFSLTGPAAAGYELLNLMDGLPTVPPLLVYKLQI